MAEQKNVPLIVALSIPVLMVGLVAVSIYIPPLFIKPMTDFIYVSDDNYYCRENNYYVEMDQIKREEVKPDQININYCQNNRSKAALYYYDIQKGITHQITYEQAANYFVDSRPVSPDGFEIAQGSGSGDIFYFGGRDYYNQYIRKGSYSRRLNVSTGQPYYNSFRFLGWVKGERRG